MWGLCDIFPHQIFSLWLCPLQPWCQNPFTISRVKSSTSWGGPVCIEVSSSRTPCFLRQPNRSSIRGSLRRVWPGRGRRWGLSGLTVLRQTGDVSKSSLSVIIKALYYWRAVMGQAQALFVFRKQQQGLNSLCVLATAAYNNRYWLLSWRHKSLNKIRE